MKSMQTAPALIVPGSSRWALRAVICIAIIGNLIVVLTTPFSPQTNFQNALDYWVAGDLPSLSIRVARRCVR